MSSPTNATGLVIDCERLVNEIWERAAVEAKSDDVAAAFHACSDALRIRLRDYARTEYERAWYARTFPKGRGR